MNTEWEVSSPYTLLSTVWWKHQAVHQRDVRAPHVSRRLLQNHIPSLHLRPEACGVIKGTTFQTFKRPSLPELWWMTRLVTDCPEGSVTHSLVLFTAALLLHSFFKKNADSCDEGFISLYCLLLDWGSCLCFLLLSLPVLCVNSSQCFQSSQWRFGSFPLDPVLWMYFCLLELFAILDSSVCSLFLYETSYLKFYAGIFLKVIKKNQFVFKVLPQQTFPLMLPHIVFKW